MNKKKTLWHRIGIAQACMALAFVSQSYAIGQDTLGTKMSLDELKASANKVSGATTGKSQIVITSAVNELKPLFKYAFWLKPLDLKPGSAYVSLSRALVIYHLVPEKTRREWGTFQISHEEDPVSAKGIAEQLRPFEHAMVELDISAEREDVAWDHRIRDSKGVALYSFIMPEVQGVRDLARLLRWRAVERMQMGDFGGAFKSIRSGFRLANLVRSGETVIQQLVANAIETTMQEAALDAIQQPGCPSLYWALAMVPHSSESIGRSLQIELSTLSRILPVLENPEQMIGDREYWQSKWRDSLVELTSLDSSSNPQLGLSTILALECASVTNETRQKLIESGLNSKQVELMSPEQVVAINTQREIQTSCDRIIRLIYLPTHQSIPLADEDAESSQRRLQQKREISIATSVLGLLLPGFKQVQIAEASRVANHNRLMTIEAIRLYAAQNNGQLPQSLEGLKPVPAFVDPFTNMPIRYKRSVEGGINTATLEIDRPNYPEHLRQLKLQIRK